MLLENKSKFLLVHSSSGHKQALKEILSDPVTSVKLADTKVTYVCVFACLCVHMHVCLPLAHCAGIILSIILSIIAPLSDLSIIIIATFVNIIKAVN